MWTTNSLSDQFFFIWLKNAKRKKKSHFEFFVDFEKFVKNNYEIQTKRESLDVLKFISRNTDLDKHGNLFQIYIICIDKQFTCVIEYIEITRFSYLTII